MFASQTTQSGRMDLRINVRAVSQGTGLGGVVTASTGNLYSDVPASMVQVGGGEKVRGVMIEAGVSAVFEIRPLALNPKQQVRLGSRVFNIKRVVDLPNSERPVTTLIQCSEVATT